MVSLLYVTIRALDKFSECQDNMSFQVQSGRTFQIIGQTYQVKRRPRKRKEKRRGGGGGGERKEKKLEEKSKKKKKGKKKGKKKNGEVNKTKERERERRGKKIELKTDSKKKMGGKYFDKKEIRRIYCVGTEPCALVYICILVTSSTTGPGGSVVSAHASQTLVGGSIPSCDKDLFPQAFFYLNYPTSYINGQYVRPSKQLNGQSIN